MTRTGSFFSELQRRHVYKVGAAYCVAGWLLVQIATQVFPFFEISNAAVRWVVIAVVAGLPVALVLAWLFDITPEGIVRTADLPASGAELNSERHRSTGRKLNVVLGVLLLGSGGFIVAEHSGLWRSAEKPGATPEATGAAEKSIAVLPFENLSDDKANAFFAAGIQDEILTRLAKIGALKVISRTSTSHYTSSPDNLPQIARELGVANILEGSVQKAGNDVHINVQLIRAATDEHLWAESYDRKLDNIFGVEGEVAQTVAEALKAKLSGREKQAIAALGTTDPAAYAAYLRGRALPTASKNSAEEGIRAMREAVSQDPGYALAWADLSIFQSFLYINGFDTDSVTAEAVQYSLNEALRLQPDAPEVKLAQAYYRYRVQHDLPAASRDFEAVLQQVPGDATVLEGLGFVERRMGHWQKAFDHLQRASELNPRDASIPLTIGGELLANNLLYDQAERWLKQALALEPDNSLALSYWVNIRQNAGDLEGAATMLTAIPEAGQDSVIAETRIYQHLLEGRDDQAIAAARVTLEAPVESLSGQKPQILIFLGLAQRRSGRAQEARQTFQEVIREIGPGGAVSVDDTVSPMLMALAEAGCELFPAAVEQAHRAIELYKNDALHVAQSYETLAVVQALGGDRAGGINTLISVQSMASRNSPAQLRLDPLFDPLRGDPRFQEVIAAGEADAKRGIIR